MKGFFAGAVLGLLAGVGVAACVGASPNIAEGEAMSQQAATVEAPAYLIVMGEVFDRPAFMEGYAGKLGPIYAQYGGEYLALGGGPTIEVLEGDYAPPSYVISKWPSMVAARTFWDSPEYAPLMKARIDNEWGEFDVLLVQGLPED